MSGPRHAGGHAGSDDDAVSIVHVVEFLARRARFIVGTALAVAMLLAGLMWLRPRTWEVTASFVPQARRVPSALSGLASQLGFAIPNTDPGTNPQFYADLLEAREILAAVVAHQYAVRRGDGDSARGSLAEVMDIDGSTPAVQRDRAIRRLRGMIAASVATRTGVVAFTVRARSPELSFQIADRLLEEVARYNQQTRQSQGAAERRFTEQRLAEVRDSLRAAENELQRFVATNRDVSNSPELRLRQDRLEREVNLRQQVYQSLAQAYEQARIEEVRDTPVFTVVDRPEVPARPRSRGTARAGIGGLLLGAVLGVVVALLRQTFAASRQAREAASV